jgi:hypothetical protein
VSYRIDGSNSSSSPSAEREIGAWHWFIDNPEISHVVIESDPTTGEDKIVITDADGILKVEIEHLFPSQQRIDFDYPSCPTAVEILFPTSNDWETSSHTIVISSC